MARPVPPPWWSWALLISVVVQLVVLYWPRSAPGAQVGGADIVVHVVVFGAVALCARKVWLPVVPVAVALGIHAVLSEVVQHVLLPGRTGDWRDVAADVVGVGLGLFAARIGRDQPAEDLA